MEHNLEVINLTKNYPEFQLKKINIKLPKGKIIGLIGENGSGKTTTIKAILNLISYDKGNIIIFGKDNKDLTKIDREQIGIVLDDSFFSPILNVNDINKLMKYFYHNWNEKLYYETIKKFKIPCNKPLKEFSSGMKMKIKVLCAIAHKPKLLILDEPTNGLDPIFRYEIIELFNNFVSNSENSILMTTHITSDLEHLADEVIFIDDGHIILDVSKKEIDNEYGIVELLENDFINLNNEDYIKCLKYKNAIYILVNPKYKFQKKYPKLEIRKPSLEELMLLLVKGD